MNRVQSVVVSGRTQAQFARRSFVSSCCMTTGANDIQIYKQKHAPSPLTVLQKGQLDNTS